MSCILYNDLGTTDARFVDLPIKDVLLELQSFTYSGLSYSDQYLPIGLRP